MSYVEKNLLSDEQIIHKANVHPIIYLKAILLFVAVSIWAIAADSETSKAGPLIMGVFFFITLPTLIYLALVKKTTEFAITNKRVITKKGLISRKTAEINLSKVEGLNVDQSILGRVLNYGTVYVSGTGGALAPFDYISQPLELRKTVNEQIEKTNSD